MSADELFNQRMFLVAELDPDFPGPKRERWEILADLVKVHHRIIELEKQERPNQ